MSTNEHLTKAIAALESIRTERVASRGLIHEANAISKARVALDRYVESLTAAPDLLSALQGLLKAEEEVRITSMHFQTHLSFETEEEKNQHFTAMFKRLRSAVDELGKARSIATAAIQKAQS
jgi:hypothetical protein